MKTRSEKDSLGEIQVPDDRYWGAQTQRSVHNFNIGGFGEAMPYRLIIAYAYLKKACATVNYDYGVYLREKNPLSKEKRDAICQAADEIIFGSLLDNFPLKVWQTGSGTQTNMNLNEVIANRATEIMGGDFRKEKLVHPNDDVNMRQSSNDTFPSAMRIALTLAIDNQLTPAISALKGALHNKSVQFKDIVKVGRTHLQDAVPLFLGQEFGGYLTMINKSAAHIYHVKATHLQEIAIGGTAVGTGLNTGFAWSGDVCKQLNKLTPKNYGFTPHPNNFHALTSHDAEVLLSGALKSLAANLMKIANDIRLLASGPRCGLGELILPMNEPGSSIMPGKVNPTQCEQVTMVAIEVMGNDAAVGFAASQGQFELNVFKPLIIHNLMRSIALLSDSMRLFANKCVIGIEPNLETIEANVENSLMLVTVLAPHIGYDNAAKVAKLAHASGGTLKQAAIELGFGFEFDKYVVPRTMAYGKDNRSH